MNRLKLHDFSREQMWAGPRGGVARRARTSIEISRVGWMRNEVIRAGARVQMWASDTDIKGALACVLGWKRGAPPAHLHRAWPFGVPCMYS